MRKPLAVFLAAFASVAVARSAKTVGQRSPAQDPPRFSPPRPPPLDQDFEDPSEDELENGDAPSRAMGAPPVPPASAPPPTNDVRPPTTAGNGSPSKLKFQMAEGEFYEKGKKRGRTPNEKRVPQSIYGGH